jgi:hypothetical protein
MLRLPQSLAPLIREANDKKKQESLFKERKIHKHYFIILEKTTANKAGKIIFIYQ